MFIDKILDSLRDDKNSIDKLAEIFENLRLVPQIIKNQETIIELLKSNKGGMSPDFRAMLLRDIARLQGMSETTNLKGKEEK